MALRASLRVFALLASTSLPAVSAKAQLVKDAGCDCYMTNGSNVAFYSEHRFYDFRNLSQYQGVPDLITDPNDAANADYTSGYFNTADWNSTWGIQSWNNSDSVDDGTAPVFMVNSPNNIYISQNGDQDASSHTYLAMRTARHESFQSAAEMESIGKGYQFLSVRMLARTVGSPGAVTALFTYRSGGDKPSQVQEADIEVLTEGPRNMIQYTNQPSFTDGADSDDIPQATRNATMPHGLDWSDWAVHRLDWTPKQSMWYVDGVEVATISFQTPRDPAQVILNAWSNGGDWSGNMTVHDEAFMHIQWLEMVFNSTQEVAQWTDTDNITDSSGISRRGEKGCKTVCSIDDTIITGVANKLWVGAAPDRLFGEATRLVAWITGLTMLATLFMI